MNIRFDSTIGEQYGLFNYAVPWHDEFQDSIADTLYTKLSIDSAQLVEAGFGTGITTKKILAKFPNAHIIAIDNVAKMKSKAQEYLGAQFSGNIEFRIGDLYKELQKISSNSIDGFYSGYVLHNIPATIRTMIIKEIYRILKPGGVYVNGDRIAMDDTGQQRNALSQAIANCSIFFTKFNDAEYYLEWVRHYLRDEELDLIFKAQDQIDLLQGLGFSSVEYVYQHDLEQTCMAIK